MQENDFLVESTKNLVRFLLKLEKMHATQFCLNNQNVIELGIHFFW